MSLRLLASLALAAALRAQDIDAETYAQLLLDSPLARSGAHDALAASWVDLVEEEPGHPLAEAACVLLSALEGQVDRPAALLERLAGLDVALLSPAAERRALLLRGELLARRDTGELRPDRFPGWLSRFAALGPLGPLDDPLAVEGADPRLTEPGFGAESAGAFDSVRWRELVRASGRPDVAASDVLLPDRGYALLATSFDLAGGGPAWIEIDVGESAEPRRGHTGVERFDTPAPPLFPVLNHPGGPFSSGTASPAYAFSVNGAPRVLVDRLAAPLSAVLRQPVVLRDGRNRLVLHVALGSGTRLAVRVLGPDGRPLAALRESSCDDAQLGTSVAGPAPAGPFPDAESWLATEEELGPYAESLLGLLLVHDRRQPDGIARLESALTRLGPRPGPATLLAGLVGNASSLPVAWRTTRARQLVEQAVAAEPTRVAAVRLLAQLESNEDKQEDALARLRATADAHQAEVGCLLQLASVHDDLDMEAAAEQALLEAEERAPESPRVLGRLVQHWEAVGQQRQALQAEQRRVASQGLAGQEQELAQRLARLGRLDEAVAVRLEEIRRDGRPGTRLSVARFLASHRRYAQADALLAGIAAELPGWPDPVLERADLAALQGDVAAEERWLAEALALDPSRQAARDRLLALTGREPTQEFYDRFRVDPAAALADFDETRWDDSVVRVLDEALVMVYPDGSFETLVLEVNQPHDLAGCEQLGNAYPRAEVRRLAVVKQADGRDYEPAEVNGDYVLPSLQPGDRVEMVTRSLSPAPQDGVLRLGSWSFQSMSEPFHLSRYVVSVPKALPLRLEQRNFQGSHEERDEGDRVVHVFEQRAAPRVQGEPFAAPSDWFLPWVEFGMDQRVEAVAARFRAEGKDLRRVSPTVVDAAREALEGVNGDEAAARRLHAYVAEALDKFQGTPACPTDALLLRAGSAEHLYAALLASADVPFDLVWARDSSPEADEEPEPPFVEADRWRQRKLVRVRPDDGAEAWCEFTSRTMPYGELLANAPRAPAFETTGGALVSVPDVAPDARIGGAIEIDILLDEAGAALVDLALAATGGIEYVAKEELRNVPDTMVKMVIGMGAAEIFPGFNLGSYAMPGLRDPVAPMGFTLQGLVPKLLDDEGGRLSCAPLLGTDELAGMVSGEGERRLPLRSPMLLAARIRMRVVTPPTLRLVDPPPSVTEEVGGGRCRQGIAREPTADGLSRTDAQGHVYGGGEAWSLTIEADLLPFVVWPEDFPAFRDALGRLDEASRAKLYFERASVDPATSPQ